MEIMEIFSTDTAKDMNRIMRIFPQSSLEDWPNFIRFSP